MPRGVYERVIAPMEERFWLLVERSPGCWEWGGNRMSNGYGRIGVDRKKVLAHRASWLIHNGPIPDGVFVCHHCDNPPCVNPDHLFLGTQRDNIHDMLAKGRHQSQAHLGEDHGMALLTEDNVRAMRAEYAAGGLTQKELAVRYGVDQTTISKAICGKTWKHI